MKIPIISTSSMKFGDLWDEGINDLIREAGQKALDDCGLKPEQIDALYVANAFSSEISGQALLSSVAYEELKIKNSECISQGDASGAIAIIKAANSIKSGQNKIVMVLGVEKMSDLKSNEILAITSKLLDTEESFIGATIHSQFAIITKKYLHDFKLNSDELCFVAAKNHKNGISNQYSQFKSELSQEKIKSSQVISDPIRMFECASYCDGACAIIMCNEKIAEKFHGKLLGYFVAGVFSSDSLPLSNRKQIYEFESTVSAAKEAFNDAKIIQGQIDLMELHDFSPISEIIAVEDLGFAKKGKGLEFIKNNIKKINPSGGLKCCGHPLGATGVRQAIDIILRLKTNKLNYGLTQTLGGIGSVSAINIFSV